jgi:hypothetical protein
MRIVTSVTWTPREGFVSREGLSAHTVATLRNRLARAHRVSLSDVSMALDRVARARHGVQMALQNRPRAAPAVTLPGAGP